MGDSRLRVGFHHRIDFCNRLCPDQSCRVSSIALAGCQPAWLRLYQTFDDREDSIQFGRTQVDSAREFIARYMRRRWRCARGVWNRPSRKRTSQLRVLRPCILKRVLILLSDYHTRRALAIFRHRLPQYEWGVTAAPDESAYGTDWWR